jgi:geranylgeranylglycerol-phosphate geranylgeranyltransferase
MDFAGKPGVYIEIIRPLNVLITILVVAVSFIMLDSWNWWALIILPLICAAGNVLNDWADADVDVYAHPDRPIPSKRMTRNDALRLSVLLFTLAIILSFNLNILSFILVLTTIFIVVIYDLWLRGVPLLGNIAVSLATSMAFLIAGSSVGRFVDMIFPASLAFFLNMSREIIKDIQDREGDMMAGRSSLPTLIGVTASLWIARIFAFAFVALSFLPLLRSSFQLLYLIFMLPTDYLVLAATFILKPSDDRQRVEHAQSQLKLAMLLTLLAIVNLKLPL